MPQSIPPDAERSKPQLSGDSPLAQGRVPSLDGLRALSIALVMFSHLCGTNGFPFRADLCDGIGDFGYLGVRVFFVISGFLITSLLLQEHQRNGRISLKNFYIRRVLRIFPAAFAFILAVVLAQAAGFFALHRHDIVCAVTYTMNYHELPAWQLGHLWSLSVEEQFYLLWPFVLALAGPRRGMMIVGVVMIAPSALRLGLWHFLPEPSYQALSWYLPKNAESLGTGCLLAGLWGYLGRNGAYLRFQRSALFLAVPVSIFLVNAWSPRVIVKLTLVSMLLNVAIALTIDWLVRRHKSPVGWVLNCRPVAFVGVLSYSLYLWQQLFLNKHVGHPLTSFPLNILLAFGCALLSYYCVEKRFLKLRKYFIPAQHGEGVGKSAPAPAAEARQAS